MAIATASEPGSIRTQPWTKTIAGNYRGFPIVVRTGLEGGAVYGGWTVSMLDSGRFPHTVRNRPPLVDGELQIHPDNSD